MSFSSDYSRSEVDFLKSMQESPKELAPKLEIDETWIILIASLDLELGFRIRSQLQEALGPQVKVIRIEKPASIKELKSAFDPEIILSDANYLFGNIHRQEDGKNEALSGMALFFSKKNSTFLKWIRENSGFVSIFEAFEQLNRK